METDYEFERQGRERCTLFWVQRVYIHTHKERTKLNYIYLSNLHHLSVMGKPLSWKTLREKICRIIIRMHFDKLNVLAVKYSFDEVILHMYVLRLSMKDMIPS